jgi:hypothetical protein
MFDDFVVARGVSKCSMVELDGLILGLGQMHCNTSADVDGLVLELFRQYGIVELHRGWWQSLMMCRVLALRNLNGRTNCSRCCPKWDRFRNLVPGDKFLF